MASINLSFVHNRLKRATSQKPVSIELRITSRRSIGYVLMQEEMHPDVIQDTSGCNFRSSVIPKMNLKTQTTMINYSVKKARPL